ncbi:hypothetical protein O1L55_27045 [Streptomyces albulus]|nr:hypothetical protein [Streptomyces noursei]
MARWSHACDHRADRVRTGPRPAVRGRTGRAATADRRRRRPLRGRRADPRRGPGLPPDLAGGRRAVRRGAPRRRAGPALPAECADAGAVAEVFLAWARGTESWQTALDWRPADLYSTPGLDAQTRAAAEERARTDIRTGFWTAEEVAQGLCDAFDPDETPVTVEQARRIVAQLWQERLAEQAQWPAQTDPDRVARAFGALASQGLTALMNFTCCGSCALSEVAGERAEGDRGFVFFHYQDTAAAADGHGLSIRYGAYPDSGADSAAIGRAVTAALAAVGLPVAWDGDPTKVIEVTPLRWHKRLPSGR